MTMTIRPDLLETYGAPVPRYTSYPTAPHFHGGIGASVYANWLEALRPGAQLSLYVHVPFCDTLCWFCGCNTKMVKRYDPVARYLPSLMNEIATVATLVPERHEITHIHWGGGSPNILAADDILRLAETVMSQYRLAAGSAFAAEIDPRELRDDQIYAFVRAGLTRISIGVQDFDPRIQAAINRIQTLQETKRAVDLFRENCVESVNIDMLYGLPHQTLRSIERTVQDVISLAPDRIALFGYAHLPSRMRHQCMIDEAALPDIGERLELARRAGDLLVNAGYVRIGLDHFARPDDELALTRVRRNFQGYTTDTADTLIGFGASAIGKLPRGYVQNAGSTPEYQRLMDAGGLATVRGYQLTREDEVRAFAIERLMCDLEFPALELVNRFGAEAAPVIGQAQDILREESNGFIAPSGNGFLVTEEGRPFLRAICARFDSYLGGTDNRHSLGV